MSIPGYNAFFLTLSEVLFLTPSVASAIRATLAPKQLASLYAIESCHSTGILKTSSSSPSYSAVFALGTGFSNLFLFLNFSGKVLKIEYYRTESTELILALEEDE